MSSEPSYGVHMGWAQFLGGYLAPQEQGALTMLRRGSLCRCQALEVRARPFRALPSLPDLRVTLRRWGG